MIIDKLTPHTGSQKAWYLGARMTRDNFEVLETKTRHGIFSVLSEFPHERDLVTKAFRNLKDTTPAYTLREVSMWVIREDKTLLAVLRRIKRDGEATCATSS